VADDQYVIEIGLVTNFRKRKFCQTDGAGKHNVLVKVIEEIQASEAELGEDDYVALADIVADLAMLIEGSVCEKP